MFKTDDDCVVHVPRLRAALAAARPDYWGRRNRNPRPSRDPRDKALLPRAARARPRSGMWRSQARALALPLSLLSQAFVSRAAFGRARYPDYCSGGGYALSRASVRRRASSRVVGGCS